MHFPRLLVVLLPAVFAIGIALGATARGEDDPKVAGPYISVEKGAVSLKEGFDAEHTTVKLGAKLTGTASLEIRDWFGAKAITGQLDVENKTKASRFLSYQLAFFDEDGVLIGAASQNMEIEAGEKTSIGGAVIHVPKAILAKVASYQIAYYEDDRKIGQR